ncbi:hypothetical protein K1719_040422 [Acacia pycnantha]|nr:hypothetical protein K1719_040422 [Acacia pycnantha]
MPFDPSDFAPEIHPNSLALSLVLLRFSSTPSPGDGRLSMASDLKAKDVIEKHRDLREPDRIVGELLRHGGNLKLVRLGLQAKVEGPVQYRWMYPFEDSSIP